MFTSFDSILADIFDRRIEKRLSLEEERALIATAKDGDDDAKLQLLYAYAPALRNGLTWYKRALPSSPSAADLEDVKTDAVLGLLEAIDAVDLDVHNRLAAIASQNIRHTVAAAAKSVTGFTVPERTLNRFFGIMREAEGNEYAAAAMAPKYKMTTETFLAVLSAVRNVTSYDADDSTDEDTRYSPATLSASPIWDATLSEEDAELAAAAFDAVDDLEESVCRLAYGFETYGSPVADVEVGHRLGFSQSKTQRVRSAALGKMREALAVD